MKLNILSTTALLAMAAVLTAQSAKAQFTSGPNPGDAASADLILSFNDAGDGTTAAAVDFEVDLGQLSNFSSTSNLDITSVSADLGVDYTTSFFTDKNIQIGIVGTNNSGGTLDGVSDTSMLVSNPSSTAFSAKGGNLLGTDSTKAGVIYTPLGDLTNVPTPGLASMSYNVKTASKDSYKQVAGADGFPLSATTTTFGQTGDAAPKLYLDLEQPDADDDSGVGSDTALAGYFDITSAGVVQYIVPSTNVPEPSTYALMVLGGALLAWQLRRKSTSSL